MYQFFVQNNQVYDKKIQITGQDVNHIGNVLRMKIGQRIRISSEDGRSFFCNISIITPEEVWADIVEEDLLGTELSNKIYLFQGLPKGDKMELIIQKAVELGVYEIIPVSMKHCVMKLDDKKAQKKLLRWNSISESAAKQSKRTIIPQVTMPISWKQALGRIEELDLVLVPYENERGMEATRELINSIKPGQSIGIIIGPEGGFAEDEISNIRDMKEQKAYPVSLGRRILRTETAGLATLSMLVFALDE